MISSKNVIENSFLNEKYLKLNHSSGLTIFLINKNMSTSYAILATDFGSMDNVFNDGNEKIQLTDGVAHFLEHKMFEEPDGSDAFERFSEFGGSANAYTTFDKTCYLFSCTDFIYENLEILLDFVTTPAFNDASINKEKDIIAQEISMGDDDPNRVVFNNMLNAMYHNSPIKIDVAGTVSSISKIDSDILNKTYKNFYSPSNMALCLCGAFEEDAVVKLCDKYFVENDYISDFQNSKNVYDEPIEIREKEIVSQMTVAQPLYSFGFKGRIFSDSFELTKKSLAVSLATKTIFGRSSDFFEKHYSSGLINKSFSVSNYAIRNHLFGVIDGTGVDPKRIYDEILKEIENVRINGINKIDFERSKKSLYSNMLMSFDSTEEIANNFVSFVFENEDFFDYIQLIIDITVEEAYNSFIELFKEEFSVVSLVLQK